MELQHLAEKEREREKGVKGYPDIHRGKSQRRLSQAISPDIFCTTNNGVIKPPANFSRGVRIGIVDVTMNYRSLDAAIL